MIAFPSAESKTQYRFAPWAGIALGLLSLLFYLVWMLPLQREYQAEKDRAEQVFQQLLDEQHDSGSLGNNFWARAKEYPEVIEEWENNRIFSEEVKEAFRKTRQIPLPLERVADGPLLQKIPLALTAHHLGILLLGMACLVLMSYVFEHLYDLQYLLVYFVLSSAGWLFLQPFLPAAYWPSPIFSWSYTIAVLLIICWLCAPGATITLTFRLWLGKFVDFKPEIPSLLVPLVFLGGLLGFTFYDSSYQSQFSLTSLAALPLEAFLLALPLTLISPRGFKAENAGEIEVNRLLASADSLFAEERHREAMDLLRQLLDQAVSPEQIRRVADLAWRNHNSDLAFQGYQRLLKDAYQSPDLLNVLAVVEEMLFRDLPVPGKALQMVVNLGLKHNQFGKVRKMLPYFRDHHEIDGETVLNAHTLLVEKLIAQANPDKELLLDISSWLERNHPDSKLLGSIQACFKKTANNSHMLDNYDRKLSIYKFVDIDLLDIGTNYIRLQVNGAREQSAPWTAITGIFGCHVATGKRGFRGCILLKFKRKIFACSFSTERILMADAEGRTLSFEEIWKLLRENIPEDLPFVSMRDFPEIRVEDKYPQMVQVFLDENVS